MANENIIDISPDLVAQVSWEDILKANNPFGFYAAAASGGSSSGAVSSVNDGLSPIARDLQSTNFQSGIQGWRLGSNGVIEASDGIFRGSITATSGTIGGWSIGATTLSATGITLDAGNKRISLGTSNEILLDGTNKKIVSSNYSTGVSGFYIDSNLIEAENIIARGTLRGTTFSYDVINAVGGQLIVANADALASDMTAQDSSTMTIKGDSTFAVNDILVIRGIATSGIQEEWFRVTNAASAPTYTVTRDLAGSFSANANPAWKAGTPVVKQGTSDGASTYSGGWLRLIGEGTNSPYYSVFKRTGLNYNNYTEALRMGNLNGFLDYSSDEYGIGVGSSTSYLKYDPTNGLRMAGDMTSLSFFEAGQALTANDWLIIASDGKLYKTDAGTSKQTLRTIGVCAVTTAAGSQAPVQMSDKTNFVSGLTLGSVYYIQSPAANISQTTTGNYDSIQDNLWEAQTFTIGGANIVCSGVHIIIKKESSPGAGVISIQGVSSSVPNGTDIASATFQASEVGTSNTDLYVAFDTPVTLSASTMYAIVAKSDGSSGANTYLWARSTSDVYADGKAWYSNDDGANWGDRGAMDFTFEILTSPGTIGTTAGVISKKIGLALSATKLLIQNT